MSKNFTHYAFTNGVKKVQARYGTRDSHVRLERSGDRYQLTAREVTYIQARDSFYMATVGENGWPYVQFRGGEKGFVRVIDDTTIGYADFKGNGQYISTGNLASNNKVALMLVDYPQRQRLKIWAESRVIEAIDDPGLLEHLRVAGYTGHIERLVLLDIQAFDWNCPRYITPRYTVEEMHSLVGDRPVRTI